MIGSYELGLKIIFVVLALLGGVVFLVHALTRGFRGDVNAAALCTYVGAISILCGFIVGLPLVSCL